MADERSEEARMEEEREERRRRRKSRWGDEPDESEKKKRKSMWDQTPAVPTMTAAQMVPAMGAVTNPALLAALSGGLPANPLLMPQVQTGPSPQMLLLLQQQQDASRLRQARRLYFGNIPPTANEQELVDFINQLVVEAHPTKYLLGGPALSASINSDKLYAFVEFKTPEDATLAMAFDGAAHNGQVIRIRRPKDYVPVTLTPDQMPMHHEGSEIVPDSPDKLYIGDLPVQLIEDQVRELLTAFGPLKSFVLIKNAQDQSVGVAYCLYADPSITDAAIEGLNGLGILDKTLVVRRADPNAQPTDFNQSLTEMTVATILNLSIPFAHILSLIPGNPSALPVPPTRVLVLLNIADDDELEDEAKYNAFKDDISLECGRFGTIKTVLIPHPKFVRRDENDVMALILPGSDYTRPRHERPDPVPGQRKVFVEYADVESAHTAAIALGGRRYATRTCITTFWDERRFEARLLDMEDPNIVLQKLADAQTAEEYMAADAPAQGPVPGVTAEVIYQGTGEGRDRENGAAKRPRRKWDVAEPAGRPIEGQEGAVEDAT